MKLTKLHCSTVIYAEANKVIQTRDVGGLNQVGIGEQWKVVIVAELVHDLNVNVREREEIKDGPWVFALSNWVLDFQVEMLSRQLEIWVEN